MSLIFFISYGLLKLSFYFYRLKKKCKICHIFVYSFDIAASQRILIFVLVKLHKGSACRRVVVRCVDNHAVSFHGAAHNFVELATTSNRV